MPKICVSDILPLGLESIALPCWRTSLSPVKTHKNSMLFSEFNSDFKFFYENFTFSLLKGCVFEGFGQENNEK